MVTLEEAEVAKPHEMSSPLVPAPVCDTVDAPSTSTVAVKPRRPLNKGATRNQQRFRAFWSASGRVPPGATAPSTVARSSWVFPDFGRAVLLGPKVQPPPLRGSGREVRSDTHRGQSGSHLLLCDQVNVLRKRTGVWLPPKVNTGKTRPPAGGV